MSEVMHEEGQTGDSAGEQAGFTEEAQRKRYEETADEQGLQVFGRRMADRRRIWGLDLGLRAHR